MIYASAETLRFWERLPPGARARTLAAERFVDFPDDPQDKGWRHRTCAGIEAGARKAGEKLSAWRAFVLSLIGNDLASPSLLLARLQSRLMVNVAGGVFEKGGLCLDRVSGVPFIPGSAVKGCARRAALAALRDWSEAGQKPIGEDHPLGAAAVEFASREAMLEAIALIFGWGDSEWKNVSDFAWACGCGEEATPEQKASWQQIRKDASQALCQRLGIDLGARVTEPWRTLPNYGGTIAFLPAYPWDGDVQIEPDVVTCHHGDYYRDGDKNAVARDTEEPVPVIFPAVSAEGQPRFAFVIIPTAREAGNNLAAARYWLADGFEVFGIGAKTNAGYGWFIAEERQQKVAEAEASRLKATETLAQQSVAREADRIKRQAEAEQARERQAEADRLAAQEAAEAAKTAEQWAADYAKLDEQAFATQAKDFGNMRDTQRRGFAAALACPARTATRKRWRDGKQKEMFKRWQDFAATQTPAITL